MRRNQLFPACTAIVTLYIKVGIFQGINFQSVLKLLGVRSPEPEIL